MRLHPAVISRYRVVSAATAISLVAHRRSHDFTGLLEEIEESFDLEKEFWSVLLTYPVVLSSPSFW